METLPSLLVQTIENRKNRRITTRSDFAYNSFFFIQRDKSTSTTLCNTYGMLRCRALDGRFSGVTVIW